MAKPRDLNIQRDPAWVALGQEITSRRVELGMRYRADLAEKTGLTTKTLGELERGDRTSYEGSTLAAVEQALDWPDGEIRRRLRAAWAAAAPTPPPVVTPMRTPLGAPPGPVARLWWLLGPDSPLLASDQEVLLMLLQAVAERWTPQSRSVDG